MDVFSLVGADVGVDWIPKSVVGASVSISGGCSVYGSTRSVGASVGFVVGEIVGFFVGELVGESVGFFVGEWVGDSVGFVVGEWVGVCEGESVGFFVGVEVGACVPTIGLGGGVGALVGLSVGDFVGLCVGGPEQKKRRGEGERRKSRRSV